MIFYKLIQRFKGWTLMVLMFFLFFLSFETGIANAISSFK